MSYEKEPCFWVPWEVPKSIPVFVSCWLSAPPEKKTGCGVENLPEKSDSSTSPSSPAFSRQRCCFPVRQKTKVWSESHFVKLLVINNLWKSSSLLRGVRTWSKASCIFKVINYQAFIKTQLASNLENDTTKSYFVSSFRFYSKRSPRGCRSEQR